MMQYGFNFQWMCSWNAGQIPEPTDERALDFLAKFGFNFVRVPLDYRFWTRDFDYFRPDQSTFSYPDEYVAACRSRGIHISLNLHRAPGYCTNRNDLERHNLWVDAVAQDGFVFLWETFAGRYKVVPGNTLSFDLIKEPPNPGKHGMTRQNHADLIRRTVAAIRAIDPRHPIVIDGLGGGYLAMPELTDLGVTHSGRGYHRCRSRITKGPGGPGTSRLPRRNIPGSAGRAAPGTASRYESPMDPGATWSKAA